MGDKKNIKLGSHEYTQLQLDLARAEIERLQHDNDQLRKAANAEAREVERLRATVAALYEWYDRDGSVGGASEVFERHRVSDVQSAPTAPGLRDVETVQARLTDVGRIKPLPIDDGVDPKSAPCPGCDGHECDWSHLPDGCKYPGVVYSKSQNEG